MDLILEWLGMALMDASKSALPRSSADSQSASQRQEVRCAVRFPLALPVMLSSDKGEIAAITRNVSASGVVFELTNPVKAGLDIVFPCGCQVKYWVPHTMYWFIAGDVWYAARGTKVTIWLHPQSTNISSPNSDSQSDQVTAIFFGKKHYGLFGRNC